MTARLHIQGDTTEYICITKRTRYTGNMQEKRRHICMHTCTMRHQTKMGNVITQLEMEGVDAWQSKVNSEEDLSCNYKHHHLQYVSMPARLLQYTPSDSSRCSELSFILSVLFYILFQHPPIFLV